MEASLRVAKKATANLMSAVETPKLSSVGTKERAGKSEIATLVMAGTKDSSGVTSGPDK